MGEDKHTSGLWSAAVLFGVIRVIELKGCTDLAPCSFLAGQVAQPRVAQEADCPERSLASAHF